MPIGAEPSSRTAGTHVELLQRRALRQPDTVACTFLDGAAERACTYRELDRWARQIGAQLQKHCAPGDRAILLLPPGLEYVAAFMGCLYAATVAVPVYPPHGTSLTRSLTRIESIIADSKPTVALTLSGIAEQTERLAQAYPGFGELRWIAIDTLGIDDAAGWQPMAVTPDDLAFLQYTSGSTAQPKGVMVSHGNLMHNGADIERFFELTPASKTVIWLPPYHDMGLIGGILQPLYTGYPTVLMSPAEFARQPLRWLRAISDHQACTSGGPNFAYELCVRKITPDQLTGLDLSHWRLAFNGAEPIRADVLDAFADLLAPTGFRREALYPCYGLAEGTLIVTGGKPGELPVVRTDESRPLVGCGQASPRQRLVIVDPVTRTPTQDGATGEIWLSGPSVAKGYWQRPADTAESFQAQIAHEEDDSFLRTGDLGFVVAGELFVTGRIKDLIIQHGVNHYPQDIEHTATRSHPALRPNGAACFTTTVAGEEQLVIVHELAKGQDGVDADEICAAIREAVGRDHMVTTHAVRLMPAGQLPRTSSGKIQRHAARERYLAETLESVGSTGIELPTVDSADRLAKATAFLRDEIAERIATAPQSVSLDRTGPALGLDSVAILEVQHRVETVLGVQLPPDMLYSNSIAALAELVATAMAGTRRTPGDADASTAQRLSSGQHGLWFLDRMTGCGAAYNLSGAVRLPHDTDTDALRRAVHTVTGRHSALRTSFPAKDGQPERYIDAARHVILEHQAPPDLSAKSIDRHLAEAAARPFDLEHDPPARVLLWTAHAQKPVLQLVVHHIAGDFWSMALLLSDLVRSYQAELSGRPPEQLPACDYTDFVRWQEDYLGSVAGQASAVYWKRQLGGELPVLQLPADRPHPPVQTFNGGTHSFTVDPGLAQQLTGLARATGTTMYTVLLCAFQVLLHRYTGQTDILVGSPVSGRSRSAFANTVGYFVNPVVMRGDLSGNPGFRALADRFRQTVSEALTHQDYPFALLTELLRPVRDPARSTIFQTMFIYHQPPAAFAPELGQLAAGHAGTPFEVAGLTLEPVAVPQPTVQFDLTLVVATTDGLAGSLQYNSDLFDPATIADLADSFVTLLTGFCQDPDVPVGDVALLSAGKRHRMLTAWNDTKLPYPREILVHEAFAEMAARQPDAVAVVHKSAALTYRELDERSSRLARRIAGLGAGPEVRVALCADRSPQMLVGLLGILKAGSAYVPLDPRYPRDRLGLMLADAGVGLVVTQPHLTGALPPTDAFIVHIDDDEPDEAVPCSAANAANSAYVLYTSGSTGTPKGVVVSHRNVLNFFAGMDERVGCGPDDTLLAVTSIGFDISVLELLWTLTRGARVLLIEDDVLGRRREPANNRQRARAMDFSLFYFTSADAPDSAGDKLRVVMDGARFADEHGFKAVWTPERHFHEFGGLYPNPSVLSAALAAVTRRVAIRAGSVVLPLHSPIRVAEEWSLVDNISAGRAGVAFASGWHADDFVFFPDRYADRKQQMFHDIDTVRSLWRGESIQVRGGTGTLVDIRIHPAPVQPELPTWITAAGSPETFVRAGAIGANVLTHLLGQTVDQVAENIDRYRAARAAHGHDPDAGTVTLMLHTFIGDDQDTVRDQVRQPFTDYLRSSVGLIENLARSAGLAADLAALGESDMDDLLAFAFDRYYRTSALLGTPATVQPLLDRLAGIGVTEIACLIDFGLPPDTVLGGLSDLDTVRQRNTAATKTASDQTDGEWQDWPLAAQIARHRPTLLQATPSMMQLITLDPAAMTGLRSLRALMLGGETLPPTLASTLQKSLPAAVHNMYGPTETTIWSATHETRDGEQPVPIGRPIANTEIYIVDSALRPVPARVPGELLIGGDGVSRGYHGRPGLTAGSFVPDPFGSAPGARLYRTGDLARYRADGTIELLGRIDRQVKVGGVRIEPGDIEFAVHRLPGVHAAAVVAVAGPAGEHGGTRLVAYVVPEPGASPAPGELQRLLREYLPHSMIPSRFVLVAELPKTANGKVDATALAGMAWLGTGTGAQAPPTTDLERHIAGIWRDVLHVDSVGMYDNFFDLGGHSILMTQVHSRLRDLIGGELPLIALLEHPTVSSLAAFLNAAPSGIGTESSFEDTDARARKQRDSRRRHRIGRDTA